MLVPWCNGSTGDFGSLGLGSNPSGTTKTVLNPKKIIRNLDVENTLRFFFARVFFFKTDESPKKLTSHVGRKTYGTMLLNKDVPIETVSNLLGHSSIRTTQKHYAKVLHMKIARDVRLVL